MSFLLSVFGSNENVRLRSLSEEVLTAKSTTTFALRSCFLQAPSSQPQAESIRNTNTASFLGVREPSLMDSIDWRTALIICCYVANDTRMLWLKLFHRFCGSEIQVPFIWVLCFK